jgi:hypothetical protein
MIISADKPNPDHVLVYYPKEKIFIDSDGTHTLLKLLRFWERIEGIKSPKIVIFNKRHIKGIPCPKSKVDATYKLLLKKMGPFKDWV